MACMNSFFTVQMVKRIKMEVEQLFCGVYNCFNITIIY